MHLKKLLIVPFFFIPLILKAQDSIQSKIHRWNLILNYTPSIFYQEPGISLNYFLSNIAIVEARYNYLFKGFYYYQYGGTGSGKYWISQGNIYRISFKLKKDSEYRRKKFFEFRFTFKNINTPHYCWADGSNGLSMIRREMRSAKRKVFLINFVYSNRIIEEEKFSIDLFFSVGGGIGSEKIKQHTYGFYGSCDQFMFPEDTEFKEEIKRPSIDTGFNFSFRIF